jgi:hypothetical protein
VRLTVVVAEAPPPEAFTVIVFVVLDAFLPTAMFIVVVPAADKELGENVTVCAPPCPETENVTAPVVVPASVIVTLPEEPRATVSDFGEAEIV